MIESLDTPTSLERLADLTAPMGRAVRERVHTGAFDADRSEHDPDGAIQVVDLTQELRAHTPIGPAALAVMFVDETQEGPLVRDLADGVEGWHGYATVALPANYMAVLLTGGRTPADLLQRDTGIEDLYRQIARAIDLMLCPAACDLEAAVAPGRSLGEQRARLIARTLARQDADDDPGNLSPLDALSRTLNADPRIRQRCAAFVTSQRAA